MTNDPTADAPNLQRVFPSASVPLKADHSASQNILLNTAYFREITEDRLLASSCLSVCRSARKDWTPTGQILMKFCTLVYIFFFWKSVDKIQVSLKSDKNKGYLTLRQTYIYNYNRWTSLIIKTVSDKSCRDNKTHSLRYVFPRIVPFIR